MLSSDSRSEVSNTIGKSLMLADGERPKRSNVISDALWALMERCWHQAPEKRPQFDEICEILSHMHDAPEPEVGETVTVDPASLDEEEGPSTSTIEPTLPKPDAGQCADVSGELRLRSMY